MTPLIFDTDQHITPPADMWTSRMPKKYAELAPRLVDIPGGGQGWSFEGGNFTHLFGLENVGSEDPRRIGWRIAYKDCAPDYWEPKSRIKAMDVDGVRAGLFFPSVAGQCFRIQHDEVFLETLRAYNDGAWDWAHDADPKRVHPAALIPNRGVEWAMNELERTVKKGFRHFQWMGPPSGKDVISSADDPFFALVEETGIVLSMHGGGSPVPAQRTSGPLPKPKQAVPQPPIRDQESVGISRGGGLLTPGPLAQVILTGVLERFPKLKLGLIETSAGWYPAFLEQLDAAWERGRWVAPSLVHKRPSETVSNVKISIDRELQGVKHRHLIGVERVMFGTDYPHVGTFWPHTRFYIDLAFDGVPEDEKEKILWSNGAELYGIN